MPEKADKQGKQARNNNEIEDADFLKRISKEELLKLFIKHLEEEYQLYKKGLSEELEVLEKEIFIPLIFSKDLSVLESVVKFLKQNKNLNFSGISRLLNRNQKTIWTTYQRAVKKDPAPIIPDYSVKIPVSIFSSRRFSPLEVLVAFLHDRRRLRFSKISQLLKKRYTTIHTAYSRYKEKKMKDGEE